MEARRFRLGPEFSKVVLDFDTLQARGVSNSEAAGKMAKSTGRYDPDVLAALRRILAAELHDEERTVKSNELVDGMILAQDIRFLDGRIFVGRGYEVNLTLRERIKNFSQNRACKNL